MKALVSVSDKTGIVDFAKELHQLGIEIISTGGTYKLLKQHHIPAIPISDVTGFPEILDGRVKTLNPKIHGGLLALRNNPEHLKICAEYEIPFIDFTIVNLYPFEQTIAQKDVTLEDAIENIDIGGPAMIRSSAKNYQSVGVVVNPQRYSDIILELKSNKGKLSEDTKKKLALEAFEHTTRYDAIISEYLAKQFSSAPQNVEFPAILTPMFKKIQDLRYGENPHQKAAFYKIIGESGLSDIQQLHGKELSYNNLIDLDSAWNIAKEFDTPAVTIIKHTNPCGSAIGDTILDAFQKAYSADPQSAYGSIIGINRCVDADTAQEIAKIFVEAIIAPDFDDDAQKILKQKPSIRLIKTDDFFQTAEHLTYRHIAGGFLVQTQNNINIQKNNIRTVTQKEPTTKEINDLIFAFKIVKHVKSNAIVIVKDGQTLGVGAGQMSRVDSVKIALEKAGSKAKGAVVASDAYFPFSDSINLMSEHKISAIIQPGGSVRDQESIDAANKNKMAMVFTDIRCFKH